MLIYWSKTKPATALADRFRQSGTGQGIQQAGTGHRTGEFRDDLAKGPGVDDCRFPQVGGRPQLAGQIGDDHIQLSLQAIFDLAAGQPAWQAEAVQQQQRKLALPLGLGIEVHAQNIPQADQAGFHHQDALMGLGKKVAIQRDRCEWHIKYNEIIALSKRVDQRVGRAGRECRLGIQRRFAGQHM